MNATVGRLSVEAPEDRPETIMRRTFNAPRDLVFLAHTSCEHITKWWGPRRHHFASCDMDFTEGGAWRYVLEGEDGTLFPFKGKFTEIKAPERLTWTFTYDVEPFNIDSSTETIVFEEQDGQTTITVTSVYSSMQVRDGVLQSGMTEGAAETW